jgi:hypothetical protein
MQIQKKEIIIRNPVQLDSLRECFERLKRMTAHIKRNLHRPQLAR